MNGRDNVCLLLSLFFIVINFKHVSIIFFFTAAFALSHQLLAKAFFGGK